MVNTWLDRDLIEKHSLDMRQFIDFRASTLPNGMRIIEAYNSSSLTFTLLPDRGMDIWSAHYNGMPLTWIAPGSPHPPDYGQSWLSLFNGGLLTTCGLTHVGHPEDGRDIHGNYTRLRATAIASEMKADAIRLRATIHESVLFGEQFEVTRYYSLSLGKPEIQIEDEIQNIGDQPLPFMLLYHCNVGYPLVREGTELVVASDVYSRNGDAKAEVETWQTYAAATVAYPEQVFFHHVRQTQSMSAQAALLNADTGLKFSWDSQNLPYLTQWKNTRQGIYVCGIEPGNCIPEGQNAARASGRLMKLQPGETQRFSLTLQVLDGTDAVEQCRADIEHIKTEGMLVTRCNLTGYELYSK